ncbi:helix-turn-helix domain-containing protein [Pedobacter cryophilus]|uniref:Helix-turn-helix domain-containing protein n=1 Tax=Pedobacter cryophilus TaxID=2571271 RepID=A0A4V5NYQ8_9SPHI|nr:helix-turn-helix domain-containing protein [Pedobacter cryophilus]TKB96770.1 helix-turn-helix domain-containing protein [Pedobacter cryophilus]
MSLKYVQANPSDVAHIITLLSHYYPVSKELADEFYKHAIAIKLEKGEHILHQGELCKYMYFIKEGALKAYSEHNHKEITTYISIENEFVSSLSGLYGQQPSREAIVAIEPAYLLGVHTDVLLNWYQHFFDLNFIIRQVYESYYRDAQERSHIIRVGNAKERYEYFVSSRASAVERLPVDCVASFLDMKPETLIRIKKQQHNLLNENEITAIITQIEDFITQTQAFKNKAITVNILAKELGIAASKITLALSTHYKLVFKDFINKYRIICFKQLLHKQEQMQSFTIETLALQSGFSSRSSFYKAFKKSEGISPTEYEANLMRS